MLVGASGAQHTLSTLMSDHTADVFIVFRFDVPADSMLSRPPPSLCSAVLCSVMRVVCTALYQQTHEADNNEEQTSCVSEVRL